MTLTKERASHILEQLGDKDLISPTEVMGQAEIDEVLSLMELLRRQDFKKALRLIANGGPKFLNSDTLWNAKPIPESDKIQK